MVKHCPLCNYKGKILWNGGEPDGRRHSNWRADNRNNQCKPTWNCEIQTHEPPKRLSKTKINVKTNMNGLLAQLETVQANRNTTQPYFPRHQQQKQQQQLLLLLLPMRKSLPPSRKIIHPMAQDIVRHPVNDFILPTHYHAALGPPPGREADLFHRGPLSSSPPPHPAMRSRSTITTTTPRSYSSTTPGTASAGSNIKKDKPASDNYNSRAPPPPTLGTGSAYGSSAEEKL